MRILMVDDDPDLREAVSLFFELRWPEAELSLAADGRSALEMQQSEQPDVVLLDLGLPDLDGLEVCSKIRERSDVPIVMLTARDREEDIVAGLNSGADDYITKPFSHRTFLARLQAIARRGGRSGPPPKTFQRGELEIDLASRRVAVSGREVHLRREEYMLLERIATREGAPVTMNELLEHVWGPEYADATDYLDSYIESLKEKLGPGAGAGEAIVKESGVGYRYEADSYV